MKGQDEYSELSNASAFGLGLDNPLIGFWEKNGDDVCWKKG